MKLIIRALFALMVKKTPYTGVCIWVWCDVVVIIVFIHNLFICFYINKS